MSDLADAMVQPGPSPANKLKQLQENSTNEREELDFFVGELERMQHFVDVPLMTRRLENHKEDALEELMEVYEEVKEVEGYLSKTINIATFIVQKHQTLFQDCIDM